MERIGLILLIISSLSAQSITRVDFEVLAGDLIQVQYSILDDDPDGVYSVQLYASLDGGYLFPIKAASVTGDVGNKVVGRGHKVILWKVLYDVPSLVSDNLVLKVTGKRRATMSGALKSLFVGNRFTKSLSNGVTLYGAKTNSLITLNSEFRTLMNNGALTSRTGGRGGLRLTTLPIVYSFDFLAHSWYFNPADSGVARSLNFLAHGDPGYADQPLYLNYGGFSFSLAYTPLPIFGFVLPKIGGGYNLHQFQIGEFGKSPISSANNRSVFIYGAVQVNIFRWLKINTTFKQSFFGERINFSEGFVDFGFHFSSR